MSSRGETPPPVRQTPGWVVLLWTALALVVVCVVLAAVQSSNLWLLPAVILTVIAGSLVIVRRRT